MACSTTYSHRFSWFQCHPASIHRFDYCRSPPRCNRTWFPRPNRHHNTNLASLLCTSSPSLLRIYNTFSPENINFTIREVTHLTYLQQIAWAQPFTRHQPGSVISAPSVVEKKEKDNARSNLKFQITNLKSIHSW